MQRYVEIYLNSIDLSKYISGGAQPKLTKENLNKIPIPVPEKSRISYVVSILDRFDTLCNDISDGLPAEIEARQIQYDAQRNASAADPDNFSAQNTVPLPWGIPEWHGFALFPQSEQIVNKYLRHVNLLF